MTTTVLVGLTLVGGAGAALADPYAPTPTGPLVVAEDGYCPGGTVTVVVSEDGEVTSRTQVPVDGDGQVSATVTGSEDSEIAIVDERCPASAPDDTVVLQERVGVQASDELPDTGGSLSPMWGGAGLVGLGAALVVATRRRRRGTEV